MFWFLFLVQCLVLKHCSQSKWSFHSEWVRVCVSWYTNHASCWHMKGGFEEAEPIDMVNYAKWRARSGRVWIITVCWKWCPASSAAQTMPGQHSGESKLAYAETRPAEMLELKHYGQSVCQSSSTLSSLCPTVQI